MLYMKIEPHLNEMERHVCGRKIINRLEERLSDPEDASLMHFQQFFITDDDELPM